MDFEEFDDPLDLDGDGDHVIDICWLLDEKKSKNEQPPSLGGNGSGCLGVMIFGFIPALALTWHYFICS